MYTFIKQIKPHSQCTQTLYNVVDPYGIFFALETSVKLGHKHSVLYHTAITLGWFTVCVCVCRVLNIIISRLLPIFIATSPWMRACSLRVEWLIHQRVNAA